MATHSSTLAWRIPRTEKPGRLQSMESQKSQTRLSNFTFTFTLLTIKSFDCVDQTNCGKFFKKWEYQTITYLLRNLYASQEATVRTGYGTMDWFQIGKGVCKGCILSPCLFNLYSESVHLVQSLSHVQLFAIPWTAARQTSLFIINSWTHVH